MTVKAGRAELAGNIKILATGLAAQARDAGLTDVAAHLEAAAAAAAAAETETKPAVIRHGDGRTIQ